MLLELKNQVFILLSNPGNFKQNLLSINRFMKNIRSTGGQLKFPK
jgi:hypothetical protein